MAKIKEVFQNVLPHPTEFENELRTWKVHISEADVGNEHNHYDLVNACNFAVKTQSYYPNIYTILQLLLTSL